MRTQRDRLEVSGISGLSQVKIIVQIVSMLIRSLQEIVRTTVRTLRVLVWPKPPFQPWTAMIVSPWLMILSPRADLRPYRMRLST